MRAARRRAVHRGAVWQPRHQDRRDHARRAHHAGIGHVPGSLRPGADVPAAVRRRPGLPREHDRGPHHGADRGPEEGQRRGGQPGNQVALMAHILLRHREIPDIHKMGVYQKNGGFEAFKKVVTSMQPNQVIDLVKASGLRGRGGAGFPTGTKWSFIDNKIWPHYVVANADESEPGTFKDREIMESNPFQFLEGVAIASFAVQAHAAYIYLRGEFWQIAHDLDQRIEEMERAGLLGEKLF